jgi:hypothetical protein
MLRITNDLLRQYFPKGTDLSVHSQAELNRVARQLRDRGREVDFVVRYQGRLLAIEVKSHKRQMALPGMDAFVKAFHLDKLLLVGGDGLDVELFLSMDAKQWLP